MTTIRCPVCNSGRIIHELGSSVRMHCAGKFSFTERTYDRCATCGHTWNRKAVQKGYQAAPTPTPSLWTRLFQRLFPFTK